MAKTVKIAPTISNFFLVFWTKENQFGGGLCAQILTNPLQGYKKINTFLELGKFAYDLVVLVRQEYF
jgi:hypothetical protein